MRPIEEDQDWLERIKMGDVAAYAFLVDKYKFMVYTIALKILRIREDAEDVAQECFLKAYQQIRQFQGKSKFSTWLYTITYRTAVSHLKENRIETSTITDEIKENYTTNYATPQHEELQSKQKVKHIKDAIEKLPPVEALLVTLFYTNDGTVKEIHEITGLSVTNIKIKLFRARRRLERTLSFLIES